MARRTHPVSAKPLSGLAVRHGVLRAELAEITLRAQHVPSYQTRRIAGLAGGTKGAVRAVELSSDGVVRPEVTFVSLDRKLR